MKKLVFSAAALTITGTAFANDSDWAQLDQDIQALSASLAQTEDEGVKIGGRIRAAYEASENISGDPTDPMSDLGGLAIYNARLYTSGTTSHGIGYRVEVDFARNATTTTVGNDTFASDIGLLDAYLDIPVGERLGVRVGQFRANVSREGMIDSGRLFFFDRSIIGAAFAGRGRGAAIQGNYDAFSWAVTAQNGSDDLGDELFYAIRGEFDILDQGSDNVRVSNAEGAFGVKRGMAATIGAAYFEDASLPDTDGFVVDGTIVSSQFSVSAGVLQVGEGGVGPNYDMAERSSSLFMPTLNDTSVISVGGSLLLSGGRNSNGTSNGYGRWDVGARFQTYESGMGVMEDDVTIVDIGLNHFVDGHDMKYTIGFTQIERGDTVAPGDDSISIFRVGVNTRF